MTSHRLPGVGPLRRDAPPALSRRPVGRGDPMVEADVASMPESIARVLDVLEYGVTVRDGLLAVPGPERVAQRVHVRIGADSRVPKQVPCAANGVAGFEDGEAGPRALRLQIVAGADARQPGARRSGRRGGWAGFRRWCHQAAAPISSSFKAPCSLKGALLQACINWSVAVERRSRPRRSRAGPDVSSSVARAEWGGPFHDSDVNVKLL